MDGKYPTESNQKKIQQKAYPLKGSRAGPRVSSHKDGFARHGENSRLCRMYSPSIRPEYGQECQWLVSGEEKTRPEVF